MPQFSLTRSVAVPPDVAFAVAADVGAYKDFLPLVQSSTIRGARTKNGSIESFRAELIVAYQALNLREAFVSGVTTDAAARTVRATSTDGPFKSATTTWTIAPDGQGSRVSLHVDYTLKSALMQLAVSGLMPMAVERLLHAFEVRALRDAQVA